LFSNYDLRTNSGYEKKKIRNKQVYKMKPVGLYTLALEKYI